MIASCDLETACGQPNCPGYDQANSSLCQHAVHPQLNKIKIIGVYTHEEGYRNFLDDVVAFDAWTKRHAVQYIFHNGKFDIKVLRAKGSTLSLRHYVGDTQCAGACVFNKIKDGWLKMYNEKRSELNALLPPKQRHRVGTPLTLKTMAPYYLGIEPFWENPQNHDDPEYNKKDCIYTFQLHEKLLALMQLDGTREFYETYLMQWQKLLCEAETEGLLIDTKLLYQMYADAVKSRDIQEGAVHEKIQPAFDAFQKITIAQITKESEEKCETFCKKLKNKSKLDGATARYAERLEKRVAALPTHFNLSSPKQMLNILTWAGIDTLVEKRDKETNEWIEKEGTDKFILKRAKVNGNEFAEVLLKYREKETEVRYLKQYIDALVGDRIYGGFSIVGTRTGRLSSSGPNLQNIKGSLRLPFIIADPDKYSIYTVDSSQIEPRVIAYLTGDKQMVTLFVEGRDYHNYATKLFFPHETEGVAEADIKKAHSPLRKTAKTGDLSCLYGTGKFTFQTMLLLREEMNIPLDECDKMIKTFKSSMESVIQWKQNLEGAYNNGTKIYDRFGFPVQAGTSVYMTLFNSLVQGMASRMIFQASYMAYKHFVREGVDAKPLAWVHDEVVWRFPKDQAAYCQQTVDHYMKCFKLDTPHGTVPLDVEGHIADRWTK